MPATKPVPATAPSKKWVDMNTNDRLVFTAKVCIMVCTGGFVFANILAGDIPPTDSAA